jgi:hypothetical protein
MYYIHPEGWLAVPAHMAGKNHNHAGGKSDKKEPEKLSAAELKKLKQQRKADANPTLAAKKKSKNDACRDRRKAAGSSKDP